MPHCTHQIMQFKSSGENSYAIIDTKVIFNEVDFFRLRHLHCFHFVTMLRSLLLNYLMGFTIILHDAYHLCGMKENLIILSLPTKMTLLQKRVT